MLTYLYLGAYSIAALLNQISVKKNSADLRGGTSDRPVFIIITGIIACFFFAALNCFSIRINAVTWIYAFIFAVIVLVTLVLDLVIYRYARIPTISVIRSTCSLSLSSVTGMLIFSEPFSIVNTLRIALLIFASILIYISQIRGESEVRDKKDLKSGKQHALFFLLMFLTVLAGTSATLLTKSFAIRTDVSDNGSYCFATNLILIGFGLIWLSFSGRGNLNNIGKGLREIRPVNYLFIILQTVSSNLGSLVEIPLAGILPVASYSAYLSALGVIVSAVSSLIFREKQDAFSSVGILIAAASFLIGIFTV